MISFRRKLSFSGQGKHLVTPAVRQHRSFPSAEFVYTACLTDNTGPGSEIQMVGIPQDDPGFHIFCKVFVEQPFYRSQGANGHENGRFYPAVLRYQYPGTGRTSRVGIHYGEFHLAKIGLPALKKYSRRKKPPGNIFVCITLNRFLRCLVFSSLFCLYLFGNRLAFGFGF